MNESIITDKFQERIWKGRLRCRVLNDLSFWNGLYKHKQRLSMSITTSRSCFSNRLEKKGVYILYVEILYIWHETFEKNSFQELLCNLWIKSNDKLVETIYQVHILIIEGHHCNYCVTIMELIEFQMHIKCFIYICIIFLWKSCDTIVH